MEEDDALSRQGAEAEHVVSNMEDDYSQPVAMQPSSGPSSQTVRVQIVVTPDDSYSTLSDTYTEAQTVKASKSLSILTVRTETEAEPEDCYLTPSGIYKEPEPVVTNLNGTASSITVRTETEAGPEGSYSTIAGIYKDPEPAMTNPIDTASSLAVKTETEAGQEESYSTVSGIYDDPEIVAIKPGNTMASLTVRTDTEPGPEDRYSTPSGIYNDPEPVIQTGNAPNSLTKTAASASPEDCYSTTSETVEKQRHGDQPGRTNVVEQERIRCQEASPDRTAPPLQNKREESLPFGRSRASLIRAFTMASGVVSVTLAVTMLGLFIGEHMENRLLDHHITPPPWDNEPTTMHGIPNDRSCQDRFCTINTTTTAVPPEYTASVKGFATGRTTNTTSALEPTAVTAKHEVLSSTTNGNEKPGKYASRQPITFAVGGSGQKILRGIAVSSGNEIFVADSYNNKVHIHNVQGAYIHHFSTLLPGHPDREMMPQDVSVDRKDNLWVLGRFSMLCFRVVQYSRDGQGLSMLELHCGARFGGIAVDPRNNNIVLRRRDRQLEIHIYRPDGSFVWKFGEGLYGKASFVAVNIDGSVLMPVDNKIHAYNQTGAVLFTFGSNGSHGGGLRGICTDSSGRVIVADRRNRRVSVFTRRGQFVRHVDVGWIMVERVAVGPNGQLVVTYQNEDTVTVFTSY
uniref:Uncharacterized protein n=1 Tax=Branchiostoma floridae TaxID=7739 RepID=C3ZRV6_BRAFL|eukprot:XP_002588745.1 hypothetical protein BRAFLDRAFT_100178 [Branchiostoma floridae]